MITAEVRHMTTRSETKQFEWDAQDEIRKAAKVWVEKANSMNVDNM